MVNPKTGLFTSPWPGHGGPLVAFRARSRVSVTRGETATTTAASKVRGVATAATAAATTTSKVRREDVRGSRTGPRVRSHLVPRAAERRTDTPSGASCSSSRGRVLAAPVLRRAYADPTRGREHGRAADGHVSGPRPEHAAGKNDGGAYAAADADEDERKLTREGSNAFGPLTRNQPGIAQKGQKTS